MLQSQHQRLVKMMIARWPQFYRFRRPFGSDAAVCYILLPKLFALPRFYKLIISNRAEVKNKHDALERDMQSCHFQRRKDLSRPTRSRRWLAIQSLAFTTFPSSSPPRACATPPQRRANTLDENEIEIRHGKDDTREADKRERQQYLARVGEWKQWTAGKIQGNALGAQAQWRSRMDKL